jgi:hypothetical protein
MEFMFGLNDGFILWPPSSFVPKGVSEKEAQLVYLARLEKRQDILEKFYKFTFVSPEGDDIDDSGEIKTVQQRYDKLGKRLDELDKFKALNSGCR